MQLKSNLSILNNGLLYTHTCLQQQQHTHSHTHTHTRLTTRTPNAFATPATVTSECNGPTPPYMKTCNDQLNFGPQKESSVRHPETKNLINADNTCQVFFSFFNFRFVL